LFKALWRWLMREPTHVCQALRCGRRIPVRHLMCRRHWALVSAPVKSEVAEEWAPGWEGDAYMVLAIVRAVNEVALSEGELMLADALEREDRARALVRKQEKGRGN
jgi:hypothetical protein